MFDSCLRDFLFCFGVVVLRSVLCVCLFGVVLVGGFVAGGVYGLLGGGGGA